MSFAFKIDKALKANLYKICRLCGIDRDDKYDILDGDINNQEPVDCDDELKLHQKIIQCIGITVCKEDKMPQSACGLCVDKINDFYEFREMCYATDVQTRKLLGLKAGVQKKIVDVKSCIDIKEEVGVKRGRKRKSDEIIAKMESTDIKREAVPIALGNKKQRLNELPVDVKKKGKFGKIVDKTLKPKEEIKEEPMDMEKPSTTNNSVTKFRHVCNICDQGFISKLKLDQHITAIHMPNIPRYVCTACNETIKKTNDIKSHQLWHKLTKTPYICGHCGQSLISSYAYSRHLRDHTVEIPPNLWVLDRECPQCHQTFLTNFLYNTHLCAVRTKKCAGCNRQLRNEVEYQRHAAHCAKVYLNYSKHIPVAALAAESTIRIKNENEVEAAAAEAFARNAGISLDMTPIVSLTRISTPEIIAASHGTTTTEYSTDSTGVLQDDAKISGKKGSKKGVSRKDLKRVDNLLKSTLDVLVSIKHEPEVHVENDSETPAASDESVQTGEESAVTSDVCFSNDDDFYHGDGDDDDVDGDNKIDDGSESVSGHTTDIAIKLEPVEDCSNANADLQVKQEVNYIRNENLSPTTKMPVLKLKIKKEHGTLNSSIVEEQSVRVEKKKKKKKRKDAIKSKEKSLDEKEVLPTDGSLHENLEVAENTLTNQIFLRPIKQEKLAETDDEFDSNKVESNELVHPETTVMTTIPIPQFQITAISSGVEFASPNEGEANDETSEAATTSDTAHIQGELEDIKPSKAELDRLFQITNVSCGVQMDQEPESEIEKETDCNTVNSNSKVPATSIAPRKSAKTTHKVVKHRSVEQKVVPQSRSARAFKSTSGVSKIQVNSNSGIAESNLGNLPQIHIKPEPVDLGYEDIFNAFESATNSSAAETLQFSMREMAERDYINNIDFATIQIKQEKELDVSDVEMTNTHIVANAIPNGKRSNGEESQYCENDEDTDSNEETDEDDEDDDNDDDWVGIKKVEEEKREYRELEMPPLLPTEVQESNENVDGSKSTFPTPHSTESLNEITDDLSSVRQVLESGNVEQNTLDCVLNNSTSLNESNRSALLEPPLLITGIYSQTDAGISVKSPQIDLTASPHNKKGYSHGKNEPLVEMPALKITSVLAGCSTSFDDFPKDCNQLIEKIPSKFSGQLTKAGDMSEDSDSINKVIGTYQEARTMCIEVNQTKDGLLDAQPFSDVRTETENSSQTILNTNIASNSTQNNPAELLGADMVEEEQNFLNQEVVEAQAIQRLIHGADQPIALIASTQNVEEAENLMNESVAEAQLQQRQEPQAELHTGNTMPLLPSDQELCASVSGSVVGNCQTRMINNTFLLDEANINEIAENNNNANIERELQDDDASTTTESSNTVNSDRRSNTDIRDTRTTDIT